MGVTYTRRGRPSDFLGTSEHLWHDPPSQGSEDRRAHSEFFLASSSLHFHCRFLVFMPPKRSLVVTPSPEDVQTEPLAKRARPPPKAVVSESPRRRAFARECKYEKGEKVIGFYGGWPYIGSVSGIESVRMSFGRTYMIQIRWNGFSGKNAVGWVSEFDIVKHNEAGLKLKADVCDRYPCTLHIAIPDGGDTEGTDEAGRD